MLLTVSHVTILNAAGGFTINDSKSCDCYGHCGSVE